MSKLWNMYHSLGPKSCSKFLTEILPLNIHKLKILLSSWLEWVQMLPVGLYHCGPSPIMSVSCWKLWMHCDTSPGCGLSFLQILVTGMTSVRTHKHTPHGTPPCASLAFNFIWYCQSFISLMSVCLLLFELYFLQSHGTLAVCSSLWLWVSLLFSPSWHAWWAQIHRVGTFIGTCFPSPHCSVPSLCRSWNLFFPLRCESVPTLWSQIVMKVSHLLMFTDVCLIFQKEFFLPGGRPVVCLGTSVRLLCFNLRVVRSSRWLFLFPVLLHLIFL